MDFVFIIFIVSIISADVVVLYHLSDLFVAQLAQLVSALDQ
jgi:hypothetical protein